MRYCVVVLLLLVLGLCACNPAKKSATDTSGTPTTSSTPATTTADTGPIKFGYNLELTGNAATFGSSGKKAAELAVDELNAAGGVLGRQIEAIWDDNASVSDQSAKVASKLINQDKAHILIGGMASSDTIAMAKLADEAMVPMISPAATNPKVTLNEDGSVRPYVFRACFTDDFQAEGMVDFVVNGPLKAKTAAIFYDADSDYSRGIWEVDQARRPRQGPDDRG